MRFPTVDYMEWAKTVPEDVVQIGGSGMPPPDPGELGLADHSLLAPGADGLYGSAEARERLAARYRVAPSQVYPTEGTSLANFLALAVLLDGGGHALVETPVYTPFRQQVEILADRVDSIARPFETGFAVDPGRVGALLRPETRVVALTNLHNPSGVRAADTTLVEVAERAARVGACLLVDEAYHDFLYDEPPGTAATLAPNIITTASFTKAYGLGSLRFGWMIGPERLVHRASRINDYLGVVQPAPSVALGLRALDHLPALGERSRRLLQRSLPVLREWLAGRDDLEVVWPGAGPILFPRLVARSAGIDPATLSERLMAESRVTMVPGRFFAAPWGMRLSATAPPDPLREGLDKLGEALDRHGRAAAPGPPAAR